MSASALAIPIAAALAETVLRALPRLQEEVTDIYLGAMTGGLTPEEVTTKLTESIARMQAQVSRSALSVAATIAETDAIVAAKPSRSAPAAPSTPGGG